MRFRFSLRTMLVLVTLVCVYLGWAMNWKRQREAFFKTQGIYVGSPPSAFTDPPFAIRLLGEKGYTSIWTMPGQAEKGRELFPEAKVSELRPRDFGT